MLGSNSEIKGHNVSLSPLMPSSVFSGESNCSIFIHILNTFILLISSSDFQPVMILFIIKKQGSHTPFLDGTGSPWNCEN